MIAKTKEREKAISLRKEGRTYSEILREIPVARSTLSLWLRDVGLSKQQKQRMTKRKLVAMRRGADARRRQRIQNTEEIIGKAKTEIGKISKRELWLIGTALYWAEGYKEKEWNHGVGMDFANSDPNMIKLYLRWLGEILKVTSDDITVRIALHRNSENRFEDVEQYWLNVTQLPFSCFQKVNWKNHNPKTVRKNNGANYYGLLQVRVRKSSALNRKIAGWIEGINTNVL